MTANPDIKTIDEILAIMKTAGYDDDQLAKMRSWHDAGRYVLVFENHDLSHYACGHKMAMPWDGSEGATLPPHGPDHPSVGMGWRYLTTFVALPDLSSIVEVGTVNDVD